jgi:hypothetical protein
MKIGIVTKPRSDSMDSLFKHSWDYSPYYWDPEAYKKRKNSILPVSSPISETAPREMNESDLTAEASHHRKGNKYNYKFLSGFSFALFFPFFYVNRKTKEKSEVC